MVEKLVFELIWENMDEVNFFFFGIGILVNCYIIEGIVYVGEGEVFVVMDFVEVEIVVDVFKEYIECFVLMNIIFIFEGIEVYDVELFIVLDVFVEWFIIIYGKYNVLVEGIIIIQGDYVGGEILSMLNFVDYIVNIEENIVF